MQQDNHGAIHHPVTDQPDRFARRYRDDEVNVGAIPIGLNCLVDAKLAASDCQCKQAANRGVVDNVARRGDDLDLVAPADFGSRLHLDGGSLQNLCDKAPLRSGVSLTICSILLCQSLFELGVGISRQRLAAQPVPESDQLP